MNIKHILLITLAVCALSVQAQQKIAVKAPRQLAAQQHAASARAMGLADNQVLLGHIVTDSITTKGAAFGAAGTYRIGAVLSSQILSAYEGCRVVGIRMAAALDMGRTNVFLCNVDDYTATPAIEQKQKIYEGWNNVFFNGDGYEIKAGDELFFGFDYVETAEMVTADQGGICGFGEDSSDGFYVYGDFGYGTALYPLSEVGRLCVQLIVDISSLPLYDIDLTWFDSGFKYKQPGETIDGMLSYSNVGRATIHNYQLGYQIDNNPPVFTEITDSIKAGEMQDWKFSPTLPTDFAIGTHTLKIIVGKVEGEALSEKSKNDTLSTKFAVYRNRLDREKVFMEIYTDQTSPYVPYLNNTLKEITDMTDLIAVVNVHKKDTPLALADALYLHDLYAYTLPSFTVNRAYFPGEKYIAYDMNDYLPYYDEPMMKDILVNILAEILMQDYASAAFATINLEPTYDAASRKLTVKATGDVLEEAKAIYGNLALTLILTENQVKSSQAVYNSKIGIVTPNNNYMHNDVLRTYITSPIGDLITEKDGKFEATYEYTLNEGWNADNINIVGILTKKVDAVTANNLLDLDVINANSVNLGALTGIKTMPAAASAKSSAVYSLDGRRVSASHLKPGLYIINGKKTVVK